MYCCWACIASCLSGGHHYQHCRRRSYPEAKRTWKLEEGHPRQNGDMARNMDGECQRQQQVCLPRRWQFAQGAERHGEVRKGS
jgi:hypothetical protein